MIEEAMNKFEELCERAENRAEYVRDGAYLDKSGNAHHVVESKLPRYDTTSVLSLASVAKCYAGSNPSAWINEHWIIAVLQDVDDWEGFEFNETDGVEGHIILPAKRPSMVSADVQLSELLKEGKWPKRVRQHDLNRFITFDLRSAAITPPELRDIVRDITWAGSDQEDVKIRHGGDAMGKSVRAEAIGKTAFPEDVTIRIEPVIKPVTNGAIAVDIKAMFVIDPTDKVVGLIPYPGELERAKNSALEQLRRQVEELLGVQFENRIFLGSPTF